MIMELGSLMVCLLFGPGWCQELKVSCTWLGGSLTVNLQPLTGRQVTRS